MMASVAITPRDLWSGSLRNIRKPSQELDIHFFMKAVIKNNKDINSVSVYLYIIISLFIPLLICFFLFRRFVFFLSYCGDNVLFCTRDMFWLEETMFHEGFQAPGYFIAGCPKAVLLLWFFLAPRL